MKNIILQHWDGELNELTKASVENIKSYAEQIDADYQMITGKPFRKHLTPPCQKVWCIAKQYEKYDQVLMLDPDVFIVKGLDKNIERRVKQMIEKGVIDEVELVYKRKWDTSLPFSKAIGAKEIISYLNKECNLDQLRYMISVKTRQFAKKQRTWQRKYMSDWEKIDTKSSKEIDIKQFTENL